jgi:hypothetical protein
MRKTHKDAFPLLIRAGKETLLMQEENVIKPTSKNQSLPLVNDHSNNLDTDTLIKWENL